MRPTVAVDNAAASADCMPAVMQWGVKDNQFHCVLCESNFPVLTGFSDERRKLTYCPMPSSFFSSLAAGVFQSAFADVYAIKGTAQ